MMSEAIQAVTHCTVNNDVPEMLGKLVQSRAYDGWQENTQLVNGGTGFRSHLRR